MTLDIETIITSHWDKISKNSEAPKETSFILHNKVLFIFRENAPMPFMVLKFSENSFLQKEYENLTEIHSHLPEITPEPFFFCKEKECSFFGQNYIPGSSMALMKSYKDRTRLSFEVLTKMHRTIAGRRFLFNQKYFDDIARQSIFHFSKEQPGLYVGLLERGLQKDASKLGSMSFPYISQHGDFSLVNLIYNTTTKGVVIVDWADFGKTQLPLYDVFLLIVCAVIQSGRYDDLLQDNKANRLTNRYLRSYLRKFKIDIHAVDLLFPLFLIIFFIQNIKTERYDTAEKMKDLIQFYLQSADKIFFLRNTE